MKAAEVKAHFPSEAALCDCFLRDLAKLGGWTAYPETAGYDILAVYDATGHQLGIEAKLALNAKVADQILPSQYMGYGNKHVSGPDFRAVIVPYIGEASAGIAKMLGILGAMVWAPQFRGRDEGFSFNRFLNKCAPSHADRREYDSSDGPLHEWDIAWHDWNPPERCQLPQIIPMVRAGVPAPIQLTPWKIGALRVLADIALDGFVTAKSVRAHGIDARRFCASDGWLETLGDGRWGRGKIPAFDQQHPEAYEQALADARQRKAQTLLPAPLLSEKAE